MNPEDRDCFSERKNWTKEDYIAKGLSFSEEEKYITSLKVYLIGIYTDLNYPKDEYGNTLGNLQYSKDKVELSSTLYTIISSFTPKELEKHVYNCEYYWKNRLIHWWENHKLFDKLKEHENTNNF